MDRNLARALGLTVEPRREGKTQRQQQKEAARKVEVDAEPMRLLRVACCPKCRAWFCCTAHRNEHRATAHKESP